MDVKRANVQDIDHDISLPTYRVYFWKKPTLTSPLPEGVSEDRLVYSAVEYELSGCHNVREVFAWADENAGADRSYTLYVTAEFAGTKALIRLFGVDPTKHKGQQTLEWPGQVYL